MMDIIDTIGTARCSSKAVAKIPPGKLERIVKEEAFRLRLYSGQEFKHSSKYVTWRELTGMAPAVTPTAMGVLGKMSLAPTWVDADQLLPVLL